MPRRQLLLGCGASRRKLYPPENYPEWDDLVTLDINPAHKPDRLWDLNQIPLPFEANEFDEIHAYEVLEHVGTQGDYNFFFRQFADFWRILKPNGTFSASVPRWDCHWAWGDPGHRRVITGGTLVFLSQKQYEQQIGKTPMTDYRDIYRGNFECMYQDRNDVNFFFLLKAIK